MGSFKLGKISMNGLFSKPVTKMYPAVVPEYYERTAGHIENEHMDTCIFCGICAKKCPTNAIEVSKPDATWAIDPFSCIGCNSCVRACPKDCLSMERTYTKPSPSKARLILHKPEAPVQSAVQEADAS